jgi:hypothetical protein
MAVHIFNCSVDTPDPNPESIPEDLCYNDMESIIEIVLEQIFEIDNAIAEHEENDTDDGCGGLSIKKVVDFSYYDNKSKISFLNDVSSCFKRINYKDNFNSLFRPELNTPPPKA